MRVTTWPLVVVVEGVTRSWTGDVAFCNLWPHPFGLLGHAGFLDGLDVLPRRHTTLEFETPAKRPRRG